ncbi:MAG: response regulator transcription factor [Chloroflexota bacterium]|nr:response regulator transcription factor [Chloroflexota bacterium]
MPDALSNRELEILRLVAEGCSNQEIAAQLSIGVSTVKKHINHIYDKLDVKNRTQAVARARERQILR